MGKITPTISFTSNSDQATTNAGPGSFAVVASISDSLSVDLVEQRLIETIAGTGSAAQSSSASLIASHKILDGHDVMTAAGSDVWTPGTVGCYIFLRNNSSTTNEDIYISIVALGGNDDPTGPAGPDANTTGPTETANTTLRTFTLLPGEFAWFPFDYLGDVYCFASAASQELEVWRFDRA